MHPYRNFYCPICCNPLDKNGDCWMTCEYEAEVSKESLPPLNRVQMLEKSLRILNTKLEKAAKELTTLSSRKKAIEAELNGSVSQ